MIIINDNNNRDIHWKTVRTIIQIMGRYANNCAAYRSVQYYNDSRIKH